MDLYDATGESVWSSSHLTVHFQLVQSRASLFAAVIEMFIYPQSSRMLSIHLMFGRPRILHHAFDHTVIYLVGGNCPYSWYDQSTSVGVVAWFGSPSWCFRFRHCTGAQLEQAGCKVTILCRMQCWRTVKLIWLSIAKPMRLAMSSDEWLLLVSLPLRYAKPSNYFNATVDG